jgi:cytoskeletal protein CcmA (bactofilin family)
VFAAARAVTLSQAHVRGNLYPAGSEIDVAAGSEVNGNAIAAGETVTIDGNVTGDLFAFGRRVTIRGEVSGDVISAAETIDIEGTVRGSVFAAARAVTLSQAQVRGNLYTAGSEIDVAANSEINGNAIAAGNGVTLAGNVGIDLMSFARDVTVRGNVQRNVTASGATVTVTPPARVGGNVTAYVGDPASVSVTPGTVIGNVDTRVNAQFGEPEQPRSEYLTAGFYVRQIVRLGAAFVTGLILFWLFPGLQTVSLASGGAALRAAGSGLIAAATMPAVAVIAAVTVIGLPIAFIVGVLWLLGLYFAKTVVAQLIGRELFKGRNGATPHYAATLLAGLVLVLIAVNMPWFGWLVSLVLTLVGLGMLVAYVADCSGRRLA